MPSNFGNQLRIFRKNAQMTQQSLAKGVGFTQSHLNRIETGRRNPPGPEKVLALARALQLPHADAMQLLDAAGYEDVRFLVPSEGVLSKTGAVSGYFSRRPTRADQEASTVPPYTNPVARLVAEVLSDRRVPAVTRREMAKQIENFAQWLRDKEMRNAAKPSRKKGATKRT